MKFDQVYTAAMNKVAAQQKQSALPGLQKKQSLYKQAGPCKTADKKGTKTASAHQLTAYDILADIAARGLHKKAGWWENYKKETAKAMTRPIAQIADQAYREGQQDALTANENKIMPQNMWGGLGIGAATGGTLAGLLADSKSSPARKLAQILAGAGLGGAAGLGFGAFRGFMDRDRLSPAPYERALDKL